MYKVKKSFKDEKLYQKKYKLAGYFQYEERYWNIFLSNEFIRIT